MHGLGQFNNKGLTQIHARGEGPAGTICAMAIAVRRRLEMEHGWNDRAAVAQADTPSPDIHSGLASGRATLTAMASQRSMSPQAGGQSCSAQG